MNQFHLTASTLSLWLNSCDTIEQLALFPRLTQTFLTDRFQGKVEQYVLDLVILNLQRALKSKFRLLRQPITPALAEEKEVYPRVYNYFITPAGNIVSRLNSVA